MKSLYLRDHLFEWGNRTYLMGIVNTTPDSFSDGGEFEHLPRALQQIETLISGGVDIIDIGGQSTRPGAQTISLEEELARTVPLIRAARQRFNIPLSIDTTRAVVAAAALQEGADLINDVSGATYDPQMWAIAAQYQAPLCLMHLRGTPATMQTLTDYDNLIGEIKDFFGQQIRQAEQWAITRERLILDPGLGFAKTGPQNLLLIRHLGVFKSLDCPLLLGPSRKSFIGEILQQKDPKQRIWGTAAVCCRAIAAGVDILRVHDGSEMAQVCRLADALWRGA